MSSQLKEASEGTDKLSSSIGLLKTVREKCVFFCSLSSQPVRIEYFYAFLLPVLPLRACIAVLQVLFFGRFLVAPLSPSDYVISPFLPPFDVLHVYHGVS